MEPISIRLGSPVCNVNTSSGEFDVDKNDSEFRRRAYLVDA